MTSIISSSAAHPKSALSEGHKATGLGDIMRYSLATVPLAAAVALSGCATMPDVTFNLLSRQGVCEVDTTETVACDALKQNLIVASATTVTVTGLADRDAKALTLRFRAIGGTAADVDETFALTDDGRLKMINASSTKWPIRASSAWRRENSGSSRMLRLKMQPRSSGAREPSKPSGSMPLAYWLVPSATVARLRLW